MRAHKYVCMYALYTKKKLHIQSKSRHYQVHCKTNYFTVISKNVLDIHMNLEVLKL